MEHSTVKTTFDKASRVIDSYKESDPLLMRKKFSVKDVYFRRGCPEHEVFRFEIAFDTEIYVILAAVATGAICALCALAHCRKKRGEKRLLKKYERSIKKAAK